MTKQLSSTDVTPPKAQQEGLPVCGVIMPISETASHTEVHWQSVQILLHRAITVAGFTPKNVWESTATDRISERIIGNIFQMPIVVADITDQNPNVMLELGLRLASKKPTIVVATSGSVIPFDIRDFHAVFYPSDMNILGMEDFFRKFGKVIQEKYRAVSNDSYIPFLGNVIVDVASPETREVGANEIILSRLTDISDRLSSIETAPRTSKGASVRVKRPVPTNAGTVTVFVPSESASSFASNALELFEVDSVREVSIADGQTTLAVQWSGGEGYFDVDSKLSEIAHRYGGDTDVPF